MSLAVETLDFPQSYEIDELEAHLQSFLNGRVRDLRLVLQDDGLVLQGQARTYYAKQLAQQEVMRNTPTPISANEIEVV